MRSAIRSSGLIKVVGKDQHDWLPRIIKGARLRVTLYPLDLAEHKLSWDTDALILQWPAVEEAESRREREPVQWKLDSGATVSIELGEEEDSYRSVPGSVFWAWLQEKGAKAGDDIILTAVDPINREYEATFEPRSERNQSLLDERNKVVKRRTESFLQTQRDNMAKPRENHGGSAG